MSNPNCLVLQILSEGRIDAKEAAVLLKAVAARPTVRSISVAKPAEVTANRGFLPWTLPSAWSGLTNEMI